eukprot:PITA_34817
MYFDRSKTHDGSGVGCVLIDPYNKNHMVSSHLEFECMNNVVEYEALVLGLQKSINLNVVTLKVVAANALANAASRVSLIRDIFTIEILYKQSILDNITNLCVFNDDQQILHFMANADVFKHAMINDEKNERSLQAEAGNRKGHLITKGVATLENIYELQECF